MLYNVTTLLKELTGAEREYQVEETSLVPWTDGEPPQVVGRVHMLRTQRGLLITAKLSTSDMQECGRCLEEYRQALTLEIEDEFVPVVDVATGLPLPPPEEDDDVFTIGTDHVLDLTEAVRQAILLARPMKPLCTDRCAGLCQECGQNLNQGPCSSHGESVDPRWESLKKLLQ